MRRFRDTGRVETFEAFQSSSFFTIGLSKFMAKHAISFLGGVLVLFTWTGLGPCVARSEPLSAGFAADVRQGSALPVNLHFQ
jgi:hypothetical protein